MTLKDILNKTIGIICDDDINLDADSKKRKKLIDSANTIYSELVEQYIELKNKEEIAVDSGKIFYSQLTKRPKDIIGIYSNGIKQNFKLYPTYIELDKEGVVEIKYTYVPSALDIDDNVLLPPPYTENMLAMGIASEYFFRSGLSDEAIFYKNRYDNALLNLSRKRNSFVLQTRGFI